MELIARPGITPTVSSARLCHSSAKQTPVGRSYRTRTRSPYSVSVDGTIGLRQNVVERVLNLLIYLLESSHPVTADEVRNTVQGYDDQTDEAFHRMFERDKDVLRRLGVPLKRQPLDVWEVDFGYSVDPEEYAIEDPRLTQEERAALSLAARMVRLGGAHLGVDALLKLGGLERGGGLEPVGADLGPGASDLGDLFAAVTGRRRIRFDYRGSPRSVEPYGIAHRRGHWYLAGAAAGEERVFRVDRMEHLEVAEEAGTFKKPRTFDIRKVMDVQPWESGPGDRTEAAVRFEADVAWWAARTLGLPEPKEGTALTAEFPVVNRDAFIGWVLSFGDGAEIIAPEEMRQEVRDRVEAAIQGVT
jgi:predicted DNA-binding transcriptional regulator YafY